ncbi:hypothetical protein L6164_004254 [Bauhinia variegata]|uniref:Uncharacterized protein n=1 Tax=Bauhinia variegata TaxID=167791 RepID=A0ACB9Q4I5_BAUVA|nr:hypothetical protein L6164_004254 [Bauhinia variegata]
MAIDGSFCVHSSLERFLARCPKLQCFPQFDFIGKKGHLLTEEEVVDILAGVFLHPGYTIPLIGCFRPIAQKFVDKAIALLRLMPNLRSNAPDKDPEDDFDKVLDDVTNVIELYSQLGRGLDLHELACLAFCRALDMAPFLLSSVLSYFKFAPSPFERFSVKSAVPFMWVKVKTRALYAARISYRLLLMETEIFSKLWDWSCFLDLLEESKDLDLGSLNESVKVLVTDLIWCGVQALAIVLKLGYRAIESLNINDEEAFACLLRWEEFCQDTALEKASWYIESAAHNQLASLNRSPDFNQKNCLKSYGLKSQAIISPKFDEVEPPFRSQRLAKWDDKSVGNFIETEALKRSSERILLAVSQRWPVLLYGPPGSGKSVLITKLAQDSGNRVLSIQMDDQIDGRTLVGGYVCTERPGEFRWQPGSLTQAVQSGFWIVFEDIDKAPSDVHSILLPLLEGAGSFMTGHGEEIRVAESFRVFSTIATSKFDTSQSAGRGSLSILWRRVMISPPDSEDLRNIVKGCYENLEPAIDKIIETFIRVNSTSLLQNAGSHSGNSACVDSLGRFSLRDLLKWSKRISHLGFSFDGTLSAAQRYSVYKEAVDVFAAFTTTVKNRLSIMQDIAKLWEVPASLAETFFPPDKPTIQDCISDLRIGRVSLQYTKRTSLEQRKPFVEIRSSLHVLERIACSVKYNEPVLLVGETGTGKTTLVQNLALRLGHKLTVLNLSQQSDVADLLGGFKPMDAQFVYYPLYMEFEDLFSKTVSKKFNEEFLEKLRTYYINKNWKMLLNGFRKGVDFFRKSVKLEKTGCVKKRKKPLDEEKIQAWEKFSLKLESACQSEVSSGMIFSFVEGTFVTALRKGEWILLDEVNLAPPETLQRIIGVLEGENGALCLAERGDVDYIHRDPNFRIFACMNPATDAGKRDLPLSLRSRFTEYFVDDVLDDNDLSLFIEQFISDGYKDKELVKKIVCFYKESKRVSEESLQDGANQKPQYSLRSLYRALEYTRKAARKFGFQKALYDGFSMFFLTLLDGPSAKIMSRMILSSLLGGHTPPHVPFDRYLTSKSDACLANYVLTKSVREHLGNLARAVLIKRYPVLLQGPTSSGKTSLVQYLASITGHEFARINNHEHTDLQEYLGSYITDASGKLVFNEGVLVKAVRNGYWIVLDELNLAPSDVLEALNRLLDDNRELFVPELQVTIHAHPDFMLFATQNPPTLYGGRKMLSRAFRNRFVEIHVGEIPDVELSTILENRCKIPESYAKKMIDIMMELQLHRQTSRVFAGKHGFITPRDLFRWANRYGEFGKSYEDLAKDGYYLLAERLRDDDEKSVVQKVLQKHLRVQLNKNNLYSQISYTGNNSSNLCIGPGGSEGFESVILTKSMQRLYFLVERCFKLREPVLLVGETGGGKTTVCQLLSACLQLKLHILNCHQYSETSDFIGGFRPVRERSRLISNYKEMIEELMKLNAFTCFPEDLSLSSDIDQASSTLDLLSCMIRKYKEGQVYCPDVTAEDLSAFEQMKLNLDLLHQKWQSIFVWQDGPLVKAMRDGDLFLVDEISLADDSVLERLNSVLEPERKLSLAEKGGSDLEKITAHPNFFVLATMNPGGDYGKKELSPALRNRFTEIWVPPVGDLDELRDIALKRILRVKDSDLDPIYQEKLSVIVDAMLSFWEWFNHLHPGRMLTVRDLISWVAFFNVTEESLGPEYAVLHGVFLVLLDGLSLGTGISKWEAEDLRERCLSFLLHKLRVDESNSLYSKLSRMGNYSWGEFGKAVGMSQIEDSQRDDLFGIDPFYIKKGCGNYEVGEFEFLAPTTRRNALRVLRAMQLPKPVLLEGSPGVGKTSLIVALGKFSGHKVVRINLSEQTDMMDLLGSDLPVESDGGMKFSWSDGILLQALKEGCWVLLDELNLAPQSVLEGLNAILDHRAEVFIPELGHTYKCPPSFRVFACQNPSHQGGGRKGLPRSFLNRFTKVYVDELVEDDYIFICRSLYPAISRPLLSKLILFNRRMHEDIMLHHKFAKDGFPWEFNLRDVIRSCQLIQDGPTCSRESCFLNTVYIQRMRTAADRKEVLRLYREIFELTPFINPYPRVQLNSHNLIVGNSNVKRNHVQPSLTSRSQLQIMPEIRQSLEAAAQCVERQWLCILTGPSCSGKTSLIRILANLTGNVLNELNLSSATDISELLGSFEQYDALRNFRTVVTQVEYYVSEYCSLQLESTKHEFLGEKKDLVSRWIAFLSSMKSESVASFTSNYVEIWNKIVCSLSLVVEIIGQLKLDIEKKSLPVSFSTKELDEAMRTIMKMKEDHQRRLISAKFEWVRGLLIKAIECGEWIVLENANLCNPTVLDRINSLVESSGSITVNERGIVDGSPLVLRPHPNFRIFLTVNPKYGEVSRAMRNRGVEIFMMQPYWILEDGRGYNQEDVEIKDVKRFLTLRGIPNSQLVDSMARAHIFAKNEGLRLNVHITYLDLSRWIHLFLQLLMNGSHPIWSLQISWEHTYLSSLGEFEGGNIINFAKTSFLSVPDLFGYDSLVRCPLVLPGGWPMPLKLRDFIYYSKEASIKQNCMYLEFLGTQYASHKYRIARDRYSIDHSKAIAGCLGTYLMDVRTLQETMFPKASCVKISDRVKGTEFDLESTNKMLLYAANWLIEQATASDFMFYLLWFRWFNSKLQPFCHFFHHYLMLVEQMIKHPIWNYISRCGHDLACLGELDFDFQTMPLLSLHFVDLVEPNNTVKFTSKFLCNAIYCVDLLRLTYQQWSIESRHELNNEAHIFVPLLSALHVLEDKFLYKLVDPSHMLVEHPSFNKFIQLYSDLVEDHVLFWGHLTSSMFEQLIISLRSLIKDAGKLRDICPEAVDSFLMESKNLKKFSSSEKSLLWVHGGHPFLPSSSDLHHTQYQLLKFVELFWPTRTTSRNQGTMSSHLIELVASFDSELRFLVMQGFSMSSFIIEKWGHDDDDAHIVKQLEEMSQMLLSRFEYEKHKLHMSTGSSGLAVYGETSVACCSFTPEILCRKSGFSSWQDTLPPVDITSLFWDMDLLQELTSIHMDDLEGLHQGVERVSNTLDSALNFSLTFSSRPPQMFSPHQKILWTLSAWTSVDAVSVKIAGFVLEMWFRWHQSLWICCPEFVKNFSKIDNYDIAVIALPHMLIQPINASTVSQIIQSPCAIEEFWLQCLKFRVTLCNMWRSRHPGKHLSNFLLSAARSLFQQIIYAHKKTFDADQFAAIKSILCSFPKSIFTEEGLHSVCTHIASSRHQRLKNSVDNFIVPLLRELYLQSATTDFNHSLGCAWLHIGALRLYLLLGCNDVDPAMKYHCKYSQLVESISLLELEIQVRKDCEYLAGQFSTEEANQSKVERLEKLQAEQRRLQRKIVFRPEPWKYKNLMTECDEFLKRFAPLEVMVSNIEAKELQHVINQACNWQETATCFIDRLTNEYTAYNDIIQPIQVAVYEMKLGLSLVLSSALEKAYLTRIGLDSIDLVMEIIYTFMRFPRSAARKLICVDYNIGMDMHPSYRLNFDSGFNWADMCLLEKLVTLSRGITADKQVSVMQIKASIHQNILLQIALSVANAKIMDSKSYMILDKIFDEFASLWMSMKVHTKSKSDYDAQQYKFRPRVFQIDSIIEVDLSTLANSYANETFSEWKEFSSEEESGDKMVATDEYDTSEEWKLLDESILSTVVLIHNQLFGSVDLVQSPGTFRVSDRYRLLSFKGSYTLGTYLIRGIQTPAIPSLDAKLMPEHLFYLCLDHGQKFLSFHRCATKYNFYKDSNAPEMAKMVQILAPFKDWVASLQNEWEDHHLQKMLDVIGMLLSLPSSTPLAKAFSGLQFLLHKALAMQENGTKFSLSSQLETVFGLVSSWQKMEVDSWPALLDEVLDLYENNAGKLWFPLYSVLQPSSSDQSVVQSMEDFIHTSSVGEFRKRLQLLFAFLGQNHVNACLNNNSSSYQAEQSRYLFNLFGFYVQFLPIVLKHIDASRKEIDSELKALVQLCRWEHTKSYLFIENFKKSRQKLKKLIQKYTDVLQEPVLILLNQKGTKAQSCHSQKLIPNVLNKGSFSVAFDLTLFNDEKRSLWFEESRRKLDCALQDLQLKKTTAFNVLSSYKKNVEEAGSMIRPCSGSQQLLLSYLEGWKAVWHSIEKLYMTAVHSGDLWKEENKSQAKRRAFSDLLKLFESSGLSRHKSTYGEDEHKTWWFLQPSGDMQYLLLTNSVLPCEISEMGENNSVPGESIVTEWKTAIEYYFKSVASVILLRQICLNPHKDITHEQVDRSSSFLNQLIQMQQKQLTAANIFDKQLKHLQGCVSFLRSLYSYSSSADNCTVFVCTIIPKQLATFKCMWQQKQLFDTLCATLHEELLLLKTIQDSHLNTCQSVRPSVSLLIDLIEKYLPIFWRSKESLDCYLIGGTKAIIPVTSSQFCIVTEEMGQSVSENFKCIKEFEEHMLVLWERDLHRSSAREALIHHFKEIFEKGKLIEEDFSSATKTNVKPIDSAEDGSSCNRNCAELIAAFDEAVISAFQDIVNVLQKLCLSSNAIAEESMVNVTSWDWLFDSFVATLNLELLCQNLYETIVSGEKLVNHAGNKVCSHSSQVGGRFRDLHMLIDLVLNFGDELIKNLLAMNISVSATTHVFANVLASLYSNGFGTATENQVDDGALKASEDRNGTGMGEGAGLNDVSDQITDEDQLLGTREQASEKEDNSNEVPSKNDTGIEMEQDFQADPQSISEDSGEDENIDGEDEQLESEMGPTGPDSEVIDEKVWNENEGETLDNTNEKYESGPSVRDRDGSNRELRAKDDSVADEPGDSNYDEVNHQNDETGSQDDISDGVETDEVNLEKEEAFTDPTGITPEQLEQTSDKDMDMDEKEDMDLMEVEDPEEQGESGENEKEETCPADENMKDADVHTDVDVTPEKDDFGEDHQEKAEMNFMDPKNNISEPGSSDLASEQVATTELASQSTVNRQTSSSENVATGANGSGSNDMYENPALLGGLPSSHMSEMDLKMADSSHTGGFTENLPKPGFPQHEHSFIHENQPNPYRNLGDALEEWKERVKVSGDLEADKTEPQCDMEDENAGEYGYVSEFEKGTAQAMGPATSEQVDRNIEFNKHDKECRTREQDLELQFEKQNSEVHTISNSASVPKIEKRGQPNVSGVEKSPDKGTVKTDASDIVTHEKLSEDLVSIRRAYFSEETYKLSELSLHDNDLGKAHDSPDVPSDMKDNAIALWRRYELSTTKLSQELAEQLRLVIEPTVASKLQGDYRTGKRINMKKVIPYIASHYRKDKIWLRRTRPNKRDYQVVIAVDDSRSMSESYCGDVATEALVTVCRAVSQLEMGSLAVASFGTTGNIKLLHDFDRPFTEEAGVKMISNLTFNQENTIANEPVVELLKYLNNMLDAAVAKARLPSGHNPLQQLVLIIADGRLNEKEKLKRRVRDVLTSNRMVAFLLLDNSKESIMDLMEASFDDSNKTFSKFSKYMDSFPFPYYIVLRNIEALPRTLADLVRQWLELMQHSTD